MQELLIQEPLIDETIQNNKAKLINTINLIIMTLNTITIWFSATIYESFKIYMFVLTYLNLILIICFVFSSISTVSIPAGNKPIAKLLFTFVFLLINICSLFMFDLISIYLLKIIPNVTIIINMIILLLHDL